MAGARQIGNSKVKEKGGGESIVNMICFKFHGFFFFTSCMQERGRDIPAFECVKFTSGYFSKAGIVKGTCERKLSDSGSDRHWFENADAAPQAKRTT